MAEKELIETDRLTIRRFRNDDWGDLHEYLSNAEVVDLNHMMYFPKRLQE